MPAAVLIVEAIVGISRECLGRAGRGVVAGVVLITEKLVRQRKIEPGLTGLSILRRLGIEG